MSARDISRSEWLALRTFGIGSSEAAAACGESKTSPAELVLQKRGIMPHVDLAEIEAVQWGNLLEPVIVKRTAEKQGLRLLDPLRDREMIEREIQSTGETEVVGWIEGRQAFLRSIKRPWQHAAIDGIAIDDNSGLIDIEAKNVGGYHSRDWNAEEGRAPAKFDVQVAHQLAVASAFTAALLSGLVAGNSLRILCRERVEMLPTIEAIITLEAGLWSCVQDATLPAFDGSESHIRALRALHPKDSGKSIDLPEGVLDLHEELLALRPMATKAEKRMKEIRNEIEAAMNGATYGILPGGAGQYTHHWQDRKATPATSFPVLRFLKV